MTTHPLPPQAYTKETLQKAYVWLLSQNASIKELASTQDMLISLYLKAQRNGEASLESPSIQNFKQELKSLANMMGDLQPAQQSVKTPAQTIVTAPQITAAAQPTALLNGLDTATLSAINEVKTTLNLSSDTEALRALVALGHKQFKKIERNT